jgi:CRISPR type III-associated protein (TIGR04423 family)
MMKIEKSTYEGYLWYSDAAEPVLYDHKELDLAIDDNANPFIIEGQLYDCDKMKSISIKFVDGQYILKSYDVNSLDFNRENVKVFHSNRMGERKLKFLQYWEEKEDCLCEGMKLLTPSKQVFVGFVKE